MKKNNIIEGYLTQHSDPVAEKYALLCLDFIDEIHHQMGLKNWSQNDLASAMGKSPAEVSKIISGEHNVTFKTLAKLAVALCEDILITQSKARSKYANEVIPVKKIASIEMEEPSYPDYDHYEASGLKIVYRKGA